VLALLVLNLFYPQGYMSGPIANIATVPTLSIDHLCAVHALLQFRRYAKDIAMLLEVGPGRIG